MKYTTALTNLFLVFFVTLFSFVNAIPIVARDVYAPPVLYPKQGTVWKIGESHHVTWDTSNPPAQITNKVGQILLRKGDVTLNVTLASNFDILLGSIQVTVPTVTPADDYRVVLFGDSGDWSGQFTITA